MPAPTEGKIMNKGILFAALLLALSTSAQAAQAADQPRMVDAGIIAATAAMVSVGSPIVALIGTAGLMGESMMFFNWLRQQPTKQEK